MLHLSESVVSSRVISSETIPESTTSRVFLYDISHLHRHLQVIKHKPSKPRYKTIKVNKHLEAHDSSLDWMSHMCPASNCHQQNVTMVTGNSENVSNLDETHKLLVMLRVTRTIMASEELFFWPSLDILFALNICFLSPANIVNDHCYACTSCGQVYSQPNPLKLHVRFECMHRTTQCSHFSLSSLVHNKSAKSSGECMRSLAPSRAATLHSSKPGLRKLHRCVYCGKVYTRKYGLKIHIRTHTGVKPLSCRFCARSFSDPSNLNKHVRLHIQQQQLQSNQVTQSRAEKTTTHNSNLTI